MVYFRMLLKRSKGLLVFSPVQTSAIMNVTHTCTHACTHAHIGKFALLDLSRKKAIIITLIVLGQKIFLV
jgi:hypothetical protein